MMNTCPLLRSGTDEVQERKTFQLKHGDYLPSDIWPQLLDDPIHFTVVPGHEITSFTAAGQAAQSSELHRATTND